MANVKASPMARPGDVCLDCGRRRGDGVALRWARLLTATSGWLCTDSWNCAEMVRQSIANTGLMPTATST